MTQAILSLMPVDSWLLPDFLSGIQNKKISGIALNMIEQFIDWICSWIYRPYRSIYQEKLNRIHRFSDAAVLLFDLTRNRVVEMDRDDPDRICLRGKKIYFNADPNIPIIFSKRAFTDYVVVKDDPQQRPGWYQIIEQSISRPDYPQPMEKQWIMNTNASEILLLRNKAVLPPAHLAPPVMGKTLYQLSGIVPGWLFLCSLVHITL